MLQECREGRRSGDRAATRRHADEDGHQGDLPPPEHPSETSAGGTYESWQSPGPIRCGRGPTHPHGAVALSVRRRGLVQPEGLVMAVVDHDGSSLLHQRRWRRHLPRHGQAEIFNTDRGSQFTSIDFTAVLKRSQIAISMDGKGAWRDNVFVERLWRSIKYEEVYLHAYKTVSEARAGIARYLNFYNTRRPHWHCCKVSDEAAFCLIQRPYISKTLLTRRISPRGSP